MARILFVWELGAGLGHVIPYLGLLLKLQRQGHHISFALPGAGQLNTLLSAHNITCLRPLMRPRSALPAVNPVCTYADLLCNCGFDKVDALQYRVDSWKKLYSSSRPDLVIFEHSPTALLAARSCSFAKAIVGAGFYTPPDVSPLPRLRTPRTSETALVTREMKLLQRINAVLQHQGLPQLDRVTQMLTADLVALTTFKELDPYHSLRPDSKYWGCTPSTLGETPVWPEAPGIRLFAYLKRHPGLDKLLRFLRGSEQPTLAYVAGLDAQTKRGLESRTFRFADKPVNIRRVATECDIAVHHAGHGATTDFLLAGRPMLLLPTVLEQTLTARRVEELGAGIALRHSRLPDLQPALQQLLERKSLHTANAAAFASRYARSDADAWESGLSTALLGAIAGGCPIASA